VAPNPEEGLLGDVLGQGLVAHDGPGQPADPGLVAADEGSCRVRVADGEAGEQGIVRRGAHMPQC
jgi:hypothetical protein